MENIGGNKIEMTIADLLPKTIAKKEDGWRLSQICSTSLDGKYELSYSFAKDMEYDIFRLVIDHDDVVPSITSVYSAAFLIENELKELFGVKIERIGIDFDNKLYRINEETPFK
ncbi:MAG: NADH-quinone oxidoreductase subunit C [Lachnospiraceae bacterium]|nr:NADH-quinone oxidoreductase subunit C [Lachnospiraceae bacterium]